MDDTTEEPSATDFTGRSPENGRFTKGNKLSRGNPFAGRMATLRTALLNAISAEDIAELAKAMIQRAKDGDHKSLKMLLEFAVGKPQVLSFGNLPGRTGGQSVSDDPRLAGPITPENLEARRAANLARFHETRQGSTENAS